MYSHIYIPKWVYIAACNITICIHVHMYLCVNMYKHTYILNCILVLIQYGSHFVSINSFFGSFLPPSSTNRVVGGCGATAAVEEGAELGVFNSPRF